MTDKCTHGWTTPPECPSCMAMELESLRQENSRLREAVTNAERNTYEDSKAITKMHGENNRLRERMNQLTDDYEGTIKRLREALQFIIEDPFINDARAVASMALNPPKRS